MGAHSQIVTHPDDLRCCQDVKPQQSTVGQPSLSISHADVTIALDAQQRMTLQFTFLSLAVISAALLSDAQ